MKDREVILGVLGELSRRLWVARTVQETAFVVGAVLFCLACFELARPALSPQSLFAYPAALAAMSLAVTAVFFELVRRSMRKIPTAQAAAHADAQAHLKDELKSAHWFLSYNADSPFAQLQLQRAAATARRLDLAVLVPHHLPANALGVTVLVLLLWALIWMNPQPYGAWNGLPGVTSSRGERAEDLRELLGGAPENAELAKLDLALAQLEKAGISAEARNQALVDARDAIDQANMEAVAAREGLSKLAATLKTDPGSAEAVHALEEGRVEDAMALLRKPAPDAALGRPNDQTRSEVTAGAPGEPRTGTPSESDTRTTGEPAEVNQEAMARVLSALDQAKDRLEVQSRVNAVKRRMEAGLTATNQRSQLTPSQFDTRANAPNPTPSPDTGNANMRGGSLFRQGAVARETNEDSPDGSRTGDASGDAPALPVQGDATRRLDAQLKLETLAQQDDVSDDGSGKSEQPWFYAASREQQSMLQARDVQVRGAYENEEASDRGRVPIRQKSVVKQYFLNLHESERK